MMVDDNIEAWQNYFGKKLNYQETEFLVNHLKADELVAFKNGTVSNAILNKLGSYNNFSEAIDYLIEAKYLEPYMKINYVATENSFYYDHDQNSKNATQLDYAKTIATLTDLYNAAINTDIKLRYGYQLVRFNHYTRKYQNAVDAFARYVEPLRVKSAPYYLALDQLAGAQRGLQNNKEANWNFFQVFIHSKVRKQSAFVSMRLSDTASFQQIVNRAQTPEEKNMAYFLLGYEKFSNPIPIMEKMYAIDPKSEILKVMAARGINELERNYLPTYYYGANNEDAEKTSKATTAAKKEEQTSFWDKVVNFFKKLFGSDENKKKESVTDNTTVAVNDTMRASDRIPFFQNNSHYLTNEPFQNFIDEFEKFTAKTSQFSDDAFWQIATAYLKFLKANYAESETLLNQIKTTDTAYQQQIARMRVLNDIVSQPAITPEFENMMMDKYPSFFTDTEKPKAGDEEFSHPNTQEFIIDVLANRYFLQGENGKSFLMNNKLSSLQYSPNIALAKSIETFYQKDNKTAFEKQIAEKMIDVKDVEPFLNVIFGDNEMRRADFKQAKIYYEKAKDFDGVPREIYNWETGGGPKPAVYAKGTYNGYRDISILIFGYNKWESFESPENVSMQAADLSAFPFIKSNMNKSELADALIQLQKIGEGKSANAAMANQLIGNLLYNTSILGYFRQTFVMDIDNSNGGKYYFNARGNASPFKYYYKSFGNPVYIEPDNFDKAISFYTKALQKTNDKEQKARILFQMASAEQGKYYQWQAKQSLTASYSDADYETKRTAFEKQLIENKDEKFHNYFMQLKEQYADTRTAKALMGSCAYFDYFMKKR